MNRLKGNIWNIAERALLEEDVGIDSDAVDLIRDCVVEFISSLSCDALTIAASSGKRRVQGRDIINSLGAFGFDQYVPPVEVFLQKWHMHSNVCQECAKLFPIPADVLQYEEDVSTLGKLAAGKQKLKKSSSAVSSSSTQVSDTDGKAAANSSSTADTPTMSNQEILTKEGKKDSRGRKSKATKDSDGNQLPSSPVKKQGKGGRQKASGNNNLNNDQFLETLRSRMLEAKKQPDMLKLLAHELKLPIKIVKDMFEQMLADEETKKLMDDNSSNVDAANIENINDSILSHDGEDGPNHQELPTGEEMICENESDGADDSEDKDLQGTLEGEENQLQETAIMQYVESTEINSLMDVDH